MKKTGIKFPVFFYETLSICVKPYMYSRMLHLSTHLARITISLPKNYFL
jgi:hypothetical protein